MQHFLKKYFSVEFSFFNGKFTEIPDYGGRFTKRRRTQAIAKRYAILANAITKLR